MRIGLVAWGLFVCGACGTDSFTSPEGGPPDAPPGDVTSGDAPTDSEGRTCSSFCSSHMSATFCCDFDQSSSPQANFTSVTATSGVNVSLSTTDPPSCPSSLLVDIPEESTATLAAPIRWFAAKEPLMEAGSDVTVSFAVMLPSMPMGGAGSADGLTVFYMHKNSSATTPDAGTTPEDYSVRIEHHTDGVWYLIVGTPANVESALAVITSPVVGAWNNMTLTVHYATDTSGYAKLIYDEVGLKTGTTIQTTPGSAWTRAARRSRSASGRPPGLPRPRTGRSASTTSS